MSSPGKVKTYADAATPPPSPPVTNSLVSEVTEKQNNSTPEEPFPPLTENIRTTSPLGNLKC